MITFTIIGLTFILKYGSILNPIRQFLTNSNSFFKELFKCSLCLGFWSGAFIGWYTNQDVLSLAFYGAAVSFFADLFLDLLQTVTIKLEK